MKASFEKWSGIRPDTERQKMTCAKMIPDYLGRVASLQPATLAVPAANFCIGPLADIRKLRKNRTNSQLGPPCLLACYHKPMNSEVCYAHQPKRNSGMKEQILESSAVQLVNKRELSRLLSCSTRTIERLVARGELPLPFKIGHGSWFSLSDIHHYIESLKGQRGMQPPHA